MGRWAMLGIEYNLNFQRLCKDIGNGTCGREWGREIVYDKHWAMCLHTFYLILYSSIPFRVGTILPTYRWEHWGPKRLNCLLKVTLLTKVPEIYIYKNFPQTLNLSNPRAYPLSTNMRVFPTFLDFMAQCLRLELKVLYHQVSPMSCIYFIVSVRILWVGSNRNSIQIGLKRKGSLSAHIIKRSGGYWNTGIVESKVFEESCQETASFYAWLLF